MTTRRQSEQRRAVGGALVGTIAGLIAVVLVVMIVQIFSLTSAIREQQISNRSVNGLLVSCVQAGGDCYADNERRTGKAVQNIGQLSVYAAACSAELEGKPMALKTRVRLIERCVTALAKADAP